MKCNASPVGAAVSAALASLLAAGSAGAQISEIVVTAEFREANVQDTPIAITAVDAEMLEARNQTSIDEVAQQAPNVTLVPAGQSRSGMVAFIRGIGQSDFSYALEPGVGLYVDDVYYPTLSNSLLELLDVERVEVLRGPQGTLAGRNSIGGAIRLYSKKPDATGGGRVEAGIGSYDEVFVNASGNFTLMEDRLYGRVALGSRQRDGYVDVLDYGCVYPDSGVPSFTQGGDCKTGEYGDNRYLTGRASLRWLASDTVEVNIIADAMNDHSSAAASTLLRAHSENPLIQPIDDGDPSTPPVYYQDHRFVPHGPYAPANAIDDPYVAYATHCDRSEGGPGVTWKPYCLEPANTLDNRGLSAQVDWDIAPGLSFTSITAWRQYDALVSEDADLSPIAANMTHQDLEHESFTQEFRLNGELGNWLDWTLGSYYLDQEGRITTRAVLNYSGLDFLSGEDVVPSSSLAFFGHGAFHLTDRMDLSLGLRWSDEEKDYHYTRLNPDGTVPGPPPAPNWQVGPLNGLSSHFADDRIDYRMALDYTFTDNVMGYAQVSTGYKGGGVNPRPYFAEQAKPFQPEELTSYELGFKSVLLDSMLRLNGAAFYNDYEDIQLNLTACEGPGWQPGDAVDPAVPCLAPRNVGTAEVRGAELEAEFYPTDALSLDASVSWLDFEYQEIEGFALQGSSIAPLDMVAPFTPELQWSLGAQYDHRTEDLGMFSLRVGINYRDEVYTEATNRASNRVDDYTLTNARFSWKSPDQLWTAALAVNNATDELYYLSSLDQQATYGAVKAQPGMPRTWRLSVRRDFR